MAACSGLIVLEEPPAEPTYSSVPDPARNHLALSTDLFPRPDSGAERPRIRSGMDLGVGPIGFRSGVVRSPGVPPRPGSGPKAPEPGKDNTFRGWADDFLPGAINRILSPRRPRFDTFCEREHVAEGGIE